MKARLTAAPAANRASRLVMDCFLVPLLEAAHVDGCTLPADRRPLVPGVAQILPTPTPSGTAGRLSLLAYPTTHYQVVLGLPVQSTLFNGTLTLRTVSSGKVVQIDGLAVGRS
jgi:hypothetical protein